MGELLENFLNLSIGVRFTAVLAVVLVLYWIFGGLLFRTLALIFYILQKLLYLLYLLVEIPVSALHRLFGSAFYSLDQGLARLSEKIHNTLEKWFKFLKKPKTIYGGKAFLIFLLMGAFLIIPYSLDLESEIFTFWHESYSKREERVTAFFEQTAWFQVVDSARVNDFSEGIEPPFYTDTDPAYARSQLVLEIPYGFVSLQRGDRGDYVTSIQLRLQELGYYSGVISGIFGEQTERSVVHFQTSQNMDANGILCVDTWKVLFGDA